MPPPGLLDIARAAYARTKGTHPSDQRLRKAGFAIHARPRGRHAVWRRAGKFYAEPEALDLIELRDDTTAGSR